MHPLQKDLLNKILKAPIIITDNAWTKHIASISRDAENTINLSSLANLLHMTYFSVINNPQLKQVIYEVDSKRKRGGQFLSPIKVVMDENVEKILVMLPEE